MCGTYDVTELSCSRGGEQLSDSGWHAPEPTVGRVLVLPGSGYTVDHPLLFWACHVADSLGWQVATLRWQVDHDEDAVSFVERGATVLERAAPDHARTVVIAKSLGTLAAGWAARREYPGIWLTPLLGDETVRTALAAGPPPLLVGGTADQHWNTETARSISRDVVEIDAANHALTIDGNWRASLDALTAVLVAVEKFLTRAGGRPA